MADTWTLFFDGACEPLNPGGVASFGYVLKKNGQVIEEGKGIAAEPGSSLATNNVAEYSAMIEGLKAATSKIAAGDAVEILGDSQLAVRQVNGEYAVRAEHLVAFHAKAAKAVWDLRSKGHMVEVRWIPREENAHADRLSKQAVKDALRADPGMLGKIRLQWGKHQGQLLTAVPEDYRRWLWKKSGGEDPLAKKEEAR